MANVAGSDQYGIFPHEVDMSEMSRPREDHQYPVSAVWGEGDHDAIPDNQCADSGWSGGWADHEGPSGKLRGLCCAECESSLC